MPFVKVGDLEVHYETGGPPEAPVLVLSHSLGADLSMWDPQVPGLQSRFRVLRYDTRGHGRTSVPAGPCRLAQLAQDALGLLDALGIARAHFCGLSMGGMIGMWLGVHAAPRVLKLALCNTGARIGSADTWNARIQSVKELGMKGIASAVVERWLSAEFHRRAPEVVARAKAMLEATSPAGYLACCEALRDADLRAEIAAIRSPTLVIAGTRDPATPPADGHFIADNIPGARYVELDASHLSNLEAAGPFSNALVDFLAG